MGTSDVTSGQLGSGAGQHWRVAAGVPNTTAAPGEVRLARSRCAPEWRSG